MVGYNCLYCEFNDNTRSLSKIYLINSPVWFYILLTALNFKFKKIFSTF